MTDIHHDAFSVRPLSVRVTNESFVLQMSAYDMCKKSIVTHISWTTAPHPENASRLTSSIDVCKIVSKRSSSSNPGSHDPSATPYSFSLTRCARDLKVLLPIDTVDDVGGRNEGDDAPGRVCCMPAKTGSMKLTKGRGEICRAWRRRGGQMCSAQGRILLWWCTY